MAVPEDKELPQLINQQTAATHKVTTYLNASFVSKANKILQSLIKLISYSLLAYGLISGSIKFYLRIGRNICRMFHCTTADYLFDDVFRLVSLPFDIKGILTSFTQYLLPFKFIFTLTKTFFFLLNLVTSSGYYRRKPSVWFKGSLLLVGLLCSSIVLLYEIKHRLWIDLTSNLLLLGNFLSTLWEESKKHVQMARQKEESTDLSLVIVNESESEYQENTSSVDGTDQEQMPHHVTTFTDNPNWTNRQDERQYLRKYYYYYPSYGAI